MYHGWKVVSCAFLIAVFGWGFGFYGIGVFLAALVERHGWATGAVSLAVTVLYLVGAVLIAFVSNAFERLGPRRVVLVGMVAMGTAAVLLTWIIQPWQLYVVFPLMAVGWAAMSGAALNVIVAPWFERQRDLAISIAFNGAAVGGVVLVPALVFLVGRIGFRAGVLTLVLAMVAVLTPLVLWLLAPARKRWGWRRTATPPYRARSEKRRTSAPHRAETSCEPGISGRWPCPLPLA